MFPSINLPRSSGCGDRTIVFVCFKFPKVIGLWRRDIDFICIDFAWTRFNRQTIYLIMLINVYYVVFYTVSSFPCMYIFLMIFVGEIIPELVWWLRPIWKAKYEASNYCVNDRTEN